jgi:uncharacterized protein YqhQ
VTSFDDEQLDGKQRILGQTRSGESNQEAAAAKLRLGGMALRNGLLVHGHDHWAVAVRGDDGRIKVASGAKPRLRGRVAELPWLRGIARLGEAFALLPLVKKRLPELQLPFEDRRVAVAMVASSALAASVRRSGPANVVREGAVAVLGMAPTALALRGSDLAAYHGVEHKSIAGYEQGTDAAEAAKEHDRCGSNLVAPMMISTVIGNALARTLLKSRGPVAGAVVTLASAAIAVELLAWSERHRDTPLARALKVPGAEMQRLFATREPTDEQLDVGRVAMAEILRIETPAA